MTESGNEWNHDSVGDHGIGAAEREGMDSGPSPRGRGRREFLRTLFGGIGTVGVVGAAGATGAARAPGAPEVAGVTEGTRGSTEPGGSGELGSLRQASLVGRLDHVAIPIQDVEEMIAFYRALGFEVRDGDPIVSVHFRDQKINFHRPGLWRQESFSLRASAARPPCGDFCWVWEGSREALHEALEAAGAEIVAEGERQGGRDRGRARGQSVYTRDPDGNLLEFIRY